MSDEGIRQDNIIRQENVDTGHELCIRCTGTGNELYSMYRSCEDCGGTGIKNRHRGTDDSR